MNANPALLSTLRRRHLLVAALLGACSTGCTIVLDADELAQGYDEGVQMVASRQCNPGNILVADGHVYWTTNYTGVTDEDACAGPESTAIRRLALGSTDEPQNIATKNLDGEMNATRPWGFTVEGGDVYWVTETEKVCTAKVDDVDQVCSPPTSLPTPCKSYGIASTNERVYFHTGNCDVAGATEIRSYATKAHVSSELGVDVDGSFVVWMGVVPVDGSSEDDVWLAWIDKCTGTKMNRMNVARLPGPTATWSRCTNSDAVFTGAIDAGGLYWTNNDEGTVYMLPLPGGVDANVEPTKLVVGLTEPGGVALDAKHVYVASDGFGGSVLHFPRGASSPLDAEALGVVASGRQDAHGGKGFPSRIAAQDPEWLYWLVNEGGNAVERARKPD
jgi:hypothetical protein